MFTIRSPREVHFGWGVIDNLPAAAARCGRRPLLVVGGSSLARSGHLDAVTSALGALGLEPVLFSGVEGDPSVQTIDRAREAFADGACDCVIAIGGGSALDAGKAVAGLCNEAAPTADFVAGAPITAPAAPVIAAATTSGTGSEVTHVSVITDPATHLKVGIRSDGMMPAVSFVDPALTLTVPPTQTAHTGLDAFTQAIESYISLGANPFSDPLALEAAVLTGRFVRAAYADGSDRDAREGMARGSMFAGLALASARLGLVHGIAHPLGALYGIAHGHACALLLPYVMEFNAGVCEARLATVARALAITGAPNDTVAALALLTWTRNLCAALGCFQPLAGYGLKRDDYPAIIEATLASGSTRSNPRPVAADDVSRLLDAAM